MISRCHRIYNFQYANGQNISTRSSRNKNWNCFKIQFVGLRQLMFELIKLNRITFPDFNKIILEFKLFCPQELSISKTAGRLHCSNPKIFGFFNQSKHCLTCTIHFSLLQAGLHSDPGVLCSLRVFLRSLWTGMRSGYTLHRTISQFLFLPSSFPALILPGSSGPII